MNLVAVQRQRPDLDYVRVSVHAEGCADIEREERREDHEWSRAGDWENVREVTEAIFGDFIFENDRQPWTDYSDYILIKPCVPKEWKRK